MQANRRFKTNLGQALHKISNNLSVLGTAFNDPNTPIATNTKFDIFQKTGIRRREGLANNSVTVSYERPSEVGQGFFGRYNPYSNVFYSTLNENKAGRLYEYRMIASYSEIANALEYICNEFITLDEQKRPATCVYSDPDATIETKTRVAEEFDYYIRLFDYEHKGAHYCWKFLVEGELFLELIVNDKTPENLTYGVLGVEEMATELVDPVWKSRSAMLLDGFIGRKVTYDQQDPNKIRNIELVPLNKNQVFYVNSGKWDVDGQYMVPFIERARRRYIQLSYIEDAVVIYRLVRAPERLVFTVPTGNMAPHDAEYYVRQVMDNYWSQKVIDINNMDITKRYNPQSMTDSYYFSKPTNGEAITVDQLKGGDNLGEIHDLQYLLRALYRDLTVPSTYLNIDGSKNNDPSQILAEELQHSNTIINFHHKFEAAHLPTFITHLKLRGVWDELKLKEQFIDIRFNQPGTYQLMRELQVAQMRQNIVSALGNNELVSKTYALKRYFKWTDAEILANYELLKAEALLKWEIEQRAANGPLWKNQLVGTGDGQPGDPAMSSGGGAPIGDMPPMGGDMGGMGMEEPPVEMSTENPPPVEPSGGPEDIETV